MKPKKTHVARARAAKSDRAGVATEPVDSAQSARAEPCESTSYADRNRRVPTLDERAWLREHRLVYHRPELFPDGGASIAFEAVRRGYRHPMSAVFWWDP